MKTYLVLIILIIFAGIACKKPSSLLPPAPKPGNPDSIDAMAITINNANWTTDSLTGVLIPLGNDSGHYNLAVTAYKQDTSSGNSELSLYISDYKGNGIYAINPPGVSATYYKGVVRHYAIFGQIVISKDSTHDIEGQFYFTADSIAGMSATNGTFSLSL